jgi:hypothetical protein
MENNRVIISLIFSKLNLIDVTETVGVHDVVDP